MLAYCLWYVYPGRCPRRLTLWSMEICCWRRPYLEKTFNVNGFVLFQRFIFWSVMFYSPFSYVREYQNKDVFIQWSGPDFCLLLWASSDYSQPITGQVTEVTCCVIGRTQPELARSKRQKPGPDVTCTTISDDGLLWSAWSLDVAAKILINKSFD